MVTKADKVVGGRGGMDDERIRVFQDGCKRHSIARCNHSAKNLTQEVTEIQGTWSVGLFCLFRRRFVRTL